MNKAINHRDQNPHLYATPEAIELGPVTLTQAQQDRIYFSPMTGFVRSVWTLNPWRLGARAYLDSVAVADCLSS